MPITEQTTDLSPVVSRQPHPCLSGFHEAVQAWFTNSFPEPTRVQQLGWPTIQTGEHTLMLAPTGSGKTLAAFLVALNNLMFDPVPAKEARCRVIYISPLKALAVDVERNLRAPLVGIHRYSERLGIPVHEPTVAIRTGDTPSRDRALFQRQPDDILITTPESLYLMLTSNVRETLRSVRWVIIDEIHAMVGTKRGAHLSLSLERLEELIREGSTPQPVKPAKRAKKSPLVAKAPSPIMWKVDTLEVAHVHLAGNAMRANADGQREGSAFQRIGLSATQRPLDEVARFLGGFESGGVSQIVDDLDVIGAALKDIEGRDFSDDAWTDDETDDPSVPSSAQQAPRDPSATPGSQHGGAELVSAHPEHAATPNTTCPPPAPVRNPVESGDIAGGPMPRPVRIVDAGSGRNLDLRVEVPVEDMARLGEIQEIPSGNANQVDARGSIWPAIHPLILDLIKQHRSTLIFVNSRRLAERLAGALNELAGEELVHAHHGSIAREQRMVLEDELKTGKVPAMVATSSLELGIDMGAIDLVIQVEAPPSVSSAMQRIGRAGHQVGAASKGVIIPKYRGDLLACAALTERMTEGAVEHMRYPRNPLDIVAQQIVAMVSVDDWRVDDLERLVRRAAPFAELPHSLFLEVLDMLSGRYPSDDFAELRPRITWDRTRGILHSREGAKRIAISNGGTIPDRGLYGAFLLGAQKGKGRVGELDEEMVFELHPGEVFVLGASSWRVEEITHDRVVVSPAPGEPGRMPFWHGDRPGRPLEFGRAIGALTRKLRGMPTDLATDLLVEKHSLDANAAKNLLQYLDDQADAIGVVPDDKTLVVESYQDEMGDWRVCILSPYGSRIHAPWAMAIGAMLRDRSDVELDILWTDDGIVVRFPEADEPPPVDLLIPDPDEVEDLVIRQLGVGSGARPSGQGAPATALFASRFREAASRALLLPRKHPGKRAPLWQQRKRAQELLQATSKFGSFPIILETYRECLRDVFDMPALLGFLREVRSRQIHLAPVTSRTPSPFAASLMFNYVANFIYEGDAPLAERRAQALSVDPVQLRELLGDSGLRDLLDLDALHELELALQHLSPERAARHTDGLHDLLIRLGDMTLDEVRARIAAPDEAGAWVAELARERRIVPLLIAGETRYIAAEDAGRYRDALGIPPPAGLPDAFLEYLRDPLGDLVARYSRTHGPFGAADIARRYSIGTAPVITILQRMAGTGKVLEGEFRPGGSGREWCDAGVLRSLRQKSLARLRKEVEPVEPAALGRLYANWQHVDPPRRGINAVFEAIEQLQGAAIPASILETQVLPARVEGFEPRQLDELMAAGEVIWVGVESLGQHDGRIRLYLAEDAPFLVSAPSGERPEGELYDRIREILQIRGASFFAQILQFTGGFPPDVQQALWDLVWAGELTNDTLSPLRAFCNPGRGASKAPDLRSRAIAAGARRHRQNRRAPVVILGRQNTTPETAGRWSLVRPLIELDPAPTPTELLSTRVNQLLERYGLLTREAVQAEGIEGGFSAIYGVLKAMEDSGIVRRGYFVAGLGATQFAVPGAVDRLRSLREVDEERIHSVILAATDPANPYGAALPWPDTNPSRRPMRQAGAQVIMIDGALAAWIPKSERQLVTFLETVPERDPSEVAYEVARVLAGQVTSLRRRAIYIEEVDGLPPQETRMGPALLEAGFSATSQGYLKRL